MKAFILICIFLSFIAVAVRAQQDTLKKDSERFVTVTTTNGNTIAGYVISNNEKELVLQTAQMGRVAIPKYTIKKIRDKITGKVVNGEYWLEDPTVTRFIPIASRPQEKPTTRTIQAGMAGGVSTSLVFTAWAGYLFNDRQGIRLGYFKQQKQIAYLLWDGEDITDATRTVSAQYQYRINVTEKFDFTLAAGPALMIPLYKEYKQYSLKNELGAAFNLGMNLWTNRRGDGEAGAGIFAGLGYLQGKKLHRVYGEFGVALRLNH